MSCPSNILQSRPKKLAFHNLCENQSMPAHVRSLLGLGLNFCIKPKISSYATFDLKRFNSDYDRKIMFSGAPEPDDNEPLTLYKSDPNWQADLPESQEILRRRCDFDSELRLLFATKRIQNTHSQPNLLPFQDAALQWLLDQPNITILSADKNLGPVAMDTTKYIDYAFKDHLSDTATYRRLSTNEAEVKLQQIRKNIDYFLLSFEKGLCNHAYNFIQRSTNENKDCPSYMYLLAKIHKTPLKTRAIISYSGSLCHGLAKWLSVELKKIITHMPYVATSSANVVRDISSRNWRSRSKLFTMDAVSMYTNIHVGHALPVILNFLRTHKLGKFIQKEEEINLGRLEFALKLVMENNVFKFGDTFWLQTAGTAMGTPPATDYATLYYAIHEVDIIPLFPEIRYYCRYIDDGFCIWTRDKNNSEAEDAARFVHFKSVINDYGTDHEFFIEEDNPLHPLEWTFSDRTDYSIFLDLQIKLFNNRIATRIYEKELNLYLYLPAHSCHPPGTLKGLIFGFVVRAKNLCTDPDDRMPYIIKCHRRLLARGYLDKQLRPIFNDAIGQILHDIEPDHPRIRQNQDHEDPIYLHLKFNPSDPSAHQLQDLFRNTVSEPPNKVLFSAVPTSNQYNSTPDFNTARVCYSAQKNLGSLLSPRKHRWIDHISVSAIADKLNLHDEP